jgi:hypothetical protein
MKDNIKMGVRQMEPDDAAWIHLEQDSAKCRVLVNRTEASRSVKDVEFLDQLNE